ncbi:MAG: bifunctional UDP-N-acetylglucosamine diphosphorylase/glucosamine-1-phosphate N-acetyltransferase GlmU [Pseudomonadota bacterium]
MAGTSAVVILAAGKGTRMKSDLPKVLHPIGNAPMLHHAMQAASALSPELMIAVVGHGGEAVAKAALDFDPGAKSSVQTEQLGTGHAVLAAREHLDAFAGDLFVLFGDTPFISADTLARMRSARATADIVALGFEAAEPGKYGRFVLEDDDTLSAIVEAKDATPDQLAIRICNSGLMCGDCQTMLRLLEKVRNDNAQAEYYLTDVIALARADGLLCQAVLCDETETLGINDRIQLAEAEAIFQASARRNAMAEGATLVAPETVFFSLDTKIGRDVLVHPNNVFGPTVSIGDRCEIKPFCSLTETVLDADVKIGPFAHTRGGCHLSNGARIGNFVELKNATLGEGTKAGHLSYLGDSSLGAGVNVGAGTITCNYNGFEKQHTTIGDDVFVGVQTALIAPVEVGDGAYIGTGTTVTKNVPADALALSRTPQVNRDGLAPRLREKFRADRERAKARKNEAG